MGVGGSTIAVHHASMLDWLASYDGPLFDSCVTDPPYHLTSIVKRFGADGAAPAKSGKTGAYARASRGFMGKQWDGGDIAFRPETWRAVYDKLKPGAHLVAFMLPKQSDLLMSAIRAAGFEVRDCILEAISSDATVRAFMDSLSEDQREAMLRCIDDSGFGGPLAWIFGCAMPKSHNQTGDWQGWGTGLKPAWETICLARKPMSGTVAESLAAHGTGAINIDACRVPVSAIDARDVGREITRNVRHADGWGMNAKDLQEGVTVVRADGRWPANVVHDDSGEVIAAFPDSNGQQGIVTGDEPSSPFANVYGDMPNRGGIAVPRGDTGSAARFFYSAKAGPLDRIGTKHATVKPVDLMRWLVRMVTPPGGHILEPFAGSGTTGIAAMAEGFDCTMIELEADHVADIERKLAFLRGEGAMTFVEHNRHREPREGGELPLFAA